MESSEDGLGAKLRGEFRAPLYDACTSPVNEIVAENCLTGNPPSEWEISGAGDPSIQGFATDISVNQGESIDFKIDTTSTDYRIDIYRLGYYNGLGARKVATILTANTTETDQLACLEIDGTTNDNLIDCGNWSESASWVVPSNAVSGIYIARLVRQDVGGDLASHIAFIVRDDDGESDLLFQTSDTTWQAYNQYGGYSLYAGPLGHAHKVSYNRPFTTRDTPTEDWLFNAEYPMLRWLERNGYDVSYFTDVDSDRNGAEILEHNVFLSVGHDEYWSAGQRANVEAARDGGVNLAFFSGNEIYWKTRWEDSYRTLVSYKEGDAQGSEHYDCTGNFNCDPDADTWTGLWRQNQTGHDGGQPENSLSGQISWGDATSAIQVPASAGSLRFWRNAGISTNTTLNDSTLGYEFDWEQAAYASSYPLSRITLSDTTATGKNHKLSLYRASSGALVFGAGTVQWSWGLDGTHDRGSSTPDARIQQATVNLFADMGVQPGSLQDGLTAASASTDTTAPTVTITSPANGATIPGGTVTVTGTASDTGGIVAAVKVSIDGGTTWNTATGTSNWSYTFNAINSSVTVQVRAIDDSVNLGTAASITFTTEAQTCPCSIFTPLITGVEENDPSAVELGVKFKSDISGYITGIRFFKTAGNNGTHTGRLWNTAGVELGTVTFSGETASGWQEATFSSPIAISANAMYIASYHTTSGNYAIGTSFASAGVDNPPLHALQGGVDGPNGVYEYGAGGIYPNDTFGSSNYLVDVVFVTSVGPDTTPPTVTTVTPINGAINVNTGGNITVTFNEAMDSLTITETTFELRDASNALVPASVSYHGPTRTATLDPDASLNLNSAYTATVIGDTSGVADLAGNELVSDYVWSFTTQGPPPNEGPGGPILVLSSAVNPFSRYYAEILRAEGLNAFTATDISNLSASLLDDYQVVILGEMSLTAPQVAFLTDWVNDDGGNLIAMRPDSQLASLLGLTSAGTTLSEAYLLVNTASAPGQGIVNQTIQFHGTADRYTLNGATSVATLYSNATTATSNPAVTIKSVGSNGGQAAAFTYDLAKSIVHTRQGNPAWIDTNGDGSLGPVRSDDLFHNGTDPDWVNLDKVAIPQADEQQRLLANMILSMNADNNPLPRFWYFPRFEKAVVVMTADDHASANVAGRFDQYIAASPAGCSVDDWECIRSSIYIYPGSTLTSTQADNYTNNGFEIGVHVLTDCNNYSLSVLHLQYTAQLAQFASRFPTLPQQDSERTHCIAWSGWAYQAEVKEDKGIRLDTNYYYWPGAWVNDRPGFFTGSGMPMRFADTDGTMFDVYQAATQMTDESGQTYPFTINSLINNALGTQGYYGVFTANMHSDNLNSPGSDAIVASAQANSVPVVSGRQLLTWLDGRNLSAFSGINWSGNTLSFVVSAGGGANGLTAMLPMQSKVGALTSITRNSSPVTFTTETIKGVQYAIFPANPGGNFQAIYAADTTDPIISAVLATPNPDGSVTITWTTDEASDSRVDYGIASGVLNLNSSNASLVTSHSITLTGLTSGTPYFFTVTSKDAADNSATSTEAGFTPLVNDPCPCSIWDNTGTPTTAPINDGQPIELGTKFRSDSNGYITAIRYYKGSGDSDTHVGHLWTSTGTLLAEVTFTGGTASGWQEMQFPAPVAINANTTYIVSIYSSPAGNFAITSGGLTTAVNNPPLKALAAGEDGPNGVFRYGGGFPNDILSNNANYWVDAVFEYNVVLDTTDPTITDRSPAVNATNVLPTTNVTVTFSEDMNPATITDTTFSLRASGAGSDVPAAVSYSAGVATLNPTSDLLSNTTYQVTVAGTLTDVAGNALGSNATWPFTTSNQTTVIDTTSADFNAGTPNACYVDGSFGDGSVRLNAGFSEEFPGSTLPAGWTTHNWEGSTVTISGDQLTVNGAEAYTSTQYGPGRTLEFVATFGSQPFQHIGFAGTNPPFNEAPWIMFSTGNDAGQVYARVLPPGSSAYNTGNDKIPVGNYIGTPHTYRIDWKTNSIDFYVDGVLKTTVTETIAAPMNVTVSDFQNAAPNFTVDWLRMSPPYASPCTFESRIINAGETVNWLDLTSIGSTPAGTSVSFETRTGNTSTPDGSWSSWEAVNSPIASPNGQYAQYRGILATTDSAQTPVIESVTLTYEVIPEYTVTFDAQGGTPTPANQTVALGGLITEPTTPTKIGHTFNGWFNAATGGLLWNFTTNTMGEDDMTLYAQWTANEYTITFNSNGGSAVSPITQAFGSSITSPADPTRAGYTFTGWNPTLPATMPLNGTALTAQWTANNYTITFDSNGGSAVAPITQAFGSSITPPADPTLAGYTFTGWSPAVPTTMPLNGATLTAQWTANEYTITFDSNGGSDVDSITQAFGSAVTAPTAPIKAGYTFAGWSPTLPATMPLNGATLTAQWTANEYTITFDSNGGSAVAPITQAFGSAVTAPADPTRAGYTFAGWSPSVPATMPLNGATLTAQWTANEYTITFESNGGSDVDPITLPFGSTVTAPTTPTKAGYTFTGWSPAVPATMPLNGATLTAQWTANEYTITFNSDGGSDVDPITLPFGSTITAPTAPIKAGYTFAGWSPAVPATMPLNGVTLTAQWTANEYTITFNSDGGSAVAPITQAFGSAVTAPAAPTKAGYTFTGWSPVVPATMPLNGATLTAQWTANEYTITFDSNGGSAVAPITQAFGSSITPPADPTRAGYTFTGWNPAVPATMPLNGATLTAQWTANNYTITFNSDGGSDVDSITLPFGSTVTAPTAPTRAGYTFAGWSPAVPATMPLNGATLTAQWSANIHSISLVEGWNLVSFNLHPVDTNITAVLSSIAGNYNLVYAWDATGNRSASGNWMKYDPNGPSFQNSLLTLDETMGFWIFMTAPDTLDVIGSKPVTTNITLLDNAGGWNLVSYPSMTNRALPTALQDNGAGTDFSLVYTYHANDATDLWKLFDRTGPSFANDLNSMTPGWGYWVKVNADTAWNMKYLPD